MVPVKDVNFKPQELANIKQNEAITKQEDINCILDV